MGKAEFSAYTVLFIGVALLVFTFINAYLFLKEQLRILAAPDLVGALGEVLTPLIEACIRVMYLGVMGWIGSILTIRGINLFTQVRKEAKPEVKPEAKLEIKPETKPEVKEEKKVKKAEEARPPEKSSQQ